jgi:hypothetical protein
VRAVNVSGAGDPVAGAVMLPVATAPAPIATVTPLAVPHAVAGLSPFAVAVRFRLPAACAGGCTIAKATLTLRDGTMLGTRRDVAVAHGGWVRLTIAIDRAALLAADGQIRKPGWRTSETRFTVAMRATDGTRWSRVKDGRIAVSLGRLASGRAPSFPGLL